ncbi:hypothetical protein M011DRAFT_467614 [Sporormia fimetaria CBS 119925]|uniref:Uncharacterized protein n=1 Tax=Sporormia fimetaria CBS 119925 TaxID=1340428 RepID=A0A6A6VCV4_9PLEO|nr:hypothetical protein M011DRAFT_467614 [Sporormia fimetaria CBS 119925]
MSGVNHPRAPWRPEQVKRASREDFPDDREFHDSGLKKGVGSTTQDDSDPAHTEGNLKTAGTDATSSSLEQKTGSRMGNV